MSLTRLELFEILSNAGLPAFAWQLPDDSYETVSAEWVTENWRAWLAARPAELVVFGSVAGELFRERPLWIADVCDCDNLAIGTLYHAQVGNALAGQRLRLPRGGLAYGLLLYTASPARPENFQIEGGHAINWFVDHARTVRCFEPGMGAFVDLSADERASTWFGIAA